MSGRHTIDLRVVCFKLIQLFFGHRSFVIRKYGSFENVGDPDATVDRAIWTKQDDLDLITK